MKTLSAGDTIYFMGIGGTGMASVAGLCQAAGLRVTGSDNALYPPTSNILADLGIEVFSPYNPENLSRVKPDAIVIANVLSRGHGELEAALASGIPYTSFPELLETQFLQSRVPVVIAGTHGKTTTSTLTAFLLDAIGADPSFMIGGKPKDFDQGFRLGKGDIFVLEGDEYDTAFFDKEPKFLHYAPQVVAFNNLEFDHADIYDSLETIRTKFVKLFGMVKDKENIVAFVGDKEVANTLKAESLFDRVTKVSWTESDADIHIVSAAPAASGWDIELRVEEKSYFVNWVMPGTYNAQNLAQAIGCIYRLHKCNALQGNLENIVSKAMSAAGRFGGVARRLDLLAEYEGTSIFEDFAHHPTAVRNVIDSLRKSHPGRRILVAFEPRNATGRRNVFQGQFAEALTHADLVYIGECAVDLRIPEAERMNTNAMASQVGKHGKAFSSNEDLHDALAKDLRKGDIAVFMSCGSFSGAQHKLAKQLPKILG